MPENTTNREPYQQAYYPPVPTGFTRYMRTSVWKMLKLLANSHH